MKTYFIRTLIRFIWWLHYKVDAEERVWKLQQKLPDPRLEGLSEAAKLALADANRLAPEIVKHLATHSPWVEMLDEK